MKTRNALYRIALLAALALTVLLSLEISSAHAQGDTSAASTKFNYVPINSVPQKARSKENPYENDPEALRAGHKVFELYCVECHGKIGQGTTRAPSLLVADVQQATPGQIFWILSNGVILHGMPDWSRIPEAQRWQVIRFVRSFTHPDAVKP
jgi:mono/diheme cytochrome c family protein